VQFDTKIAVVLRRDLAVWQKINVAVFATSGIAGVDPSTVGEPYEDADGNRYLPMFRQPVLVFSAGRDELRAAYETARARGLALAVYTEELFATGHDDANRAAVRALPAQGLELVGIALRARKRDVDRVVRGLRLHE
jgi:hypothetical protein